MARSSKAISGLNHEFTEVPYHTWGPWRNHWGYVTTIAQFSPEDIVLKTVKPDNNKVIKYFDGWEECADYVDLIEQDRRF